MDKLRIIEKGDKVRIIKEKGTVGLLGAVVTVSQSNDEFVDAEILGNIVRFNTDDVELVEKCPKLSIPLYHGTDARFATLSEEYRKTYLDACSIIINKLFDKYTPYLYSNDDTRLKNLIREDRLSAFPNLIKEINSTCAILRLNASGCKEYEYGDFYLTSNKFSATIYAIQAFAGGEWGNHAYKLLHLTEQAELSEWLNEIPSNLIQLIKLFAETKPQPVLFEFNDLNLDDLRTEHGERVEKYIKNGQLKGVDSFRYLKPIELDLNKAIPVDKSMIQSS